MKSFYQFIQEKWVADFPKRGISFPIYENPSSKDLIDLKKSGLTDDLVRFAALLVSKKLYVWSGMDVIHSVALKRLYENKIISKIQHDNLDQALCGECRIIDGRLSFALNDGMDSYFGEMIYEIKGKQRFKASAFVPLPYEDTKELITDLPNIIANYKWVGKYIDNYETKSSPVILLQHTKNKS